MTEWTSPHPIPSHIAMHVVELLQMIGENVLQGSDIPKLLEKQEIKPCYLMRGDTKAPLCEEEFRMLVGFKFGSDRFGFGRTEPIPKETGS